MGDLIEINGEEYIRVEGLFAKILDYLVDGTSDIYVHSSCDELADEVGQFLVENGRSEQAIGFKKMYIHRRFGKLLTQE